MINTIIHFFTEREMNSRKQTHDYGQKIVQYAETHNDCEFLSFLDDFKFIWTNVTRA